MNVDFLIEPGMNNCPLQVFNDLSGITNDDIKKIIYNFGPIGVSIDASNLETSYDDDILNLKSITKSNPANHAVCIVGWDGNTWIMKNSWGKDVGDHGFYGILFGENIFGSIMFVDKSNPSPSNPYKLKLNKDYKWEHSDQRDTDDHKNLIKDIKNYKPNNPSYSNTNTSSKKTSLKKYLDKQQLKITKFYNNNFYNKLLWYNKQNPLSMSIVGVSRLQGNCSDCWLYTGLEVVESAICAQVFFTYKKFFYKYTSLNYYLYNKGIFSDIPKCKGGNFEIFNKMLNGVQKNIPLYIGLQGLGITDSPKLYIRMNPHVLICWVSFILSLIFFLMIVDKHIHKFEHYTALILSIILSIFSWYYFIIYIFDTK